MKTQLQIVEFALPENIIGFVSLCSGLIVLNKLYQCKNKANYYLALLEDAACRGYDCVLEQKGNDVVRELSVSI